MAQERDSEEACVTGLEGKGERTGVGVGGGGPLIMALIGTAGICVLFCHVGEPFERENDLSLTVDSGAC